MWHVGSFRVPNRLIHVLAIDSRVSVLHGVEIHPSHWLEASLLIQCCVTMHAACDLLPVTSIIRATSACMLTASTFSYLLIKANPGFCIAATATVFYPRDAAKSHYTAYTAIRTSDSTSLKMTLGRWVIIIIIIRLGLSRFHSRVLLGKWVKYDVLWLLIPLFLQFGPQNF